MWWHLTKKKRLSIFIRIFYGVIQGWVSVQEGACLSACGSWTHHTRSAMWSRWNAKSAWSEIMTFQSREEILGKKAAWTSVYEHSSGIKDTEVQFLVLRLTHSWLQWIECLCPSIPQFMCWILTHNMMVLGGGAFERWLGHECRALMNGISVLIKGTPQSSLTLFPPWEDTARRGPFVTWREPSPDIESAGALISDFQPPHCEK